MGRPFGCHCMVHVRHAIHFAGARARHLYPSPAGSWMIPVIRPRNPNSTSARGALVDSPISARATFSVNWC
jgi:hypothetical protein